jgi:hypothetical protein
VTTANYQTAADVFDLWRDELLKGESPPLFRVGDDELSRIEIG